MGDEGDQEWLSSRARPRGGSGPSVSLVDLFAGCGGLTLGVQEAVRQSGRQLCIPIAAEVDALAARTYASNFGLDAAHVQVDVAQYFDGRLGDRPTPAERQTKKIAGEVDLLVGGPPCQGHSTLNNHTRGFDDKNELYLMMVRATEVLRPRAIVIENVPAVERDSRRVVGRAIGLLEELHYSVSHTVVEMVDLGVPQLRRRHVLVAHRDHEVQIAPLLAAAKVPERRGLEWAWARLRPDPERLLDAPSRLSPENFRRATLLHEHDLYDLPASHRPPCQQGDHKYKSMYGRLKLHEPAQTITTGYGSPGQGRYLHPTELRTLTAHEAARLQFFPDWFDFGALTTRTALATAIGNAVPPKLGFVLAHSLLGL